MAGSLAYSPFAPEVLRDPLPFYARLRAESPAHYLPEFDGWALSRFEDAWRAAGDADGFTSRLGTTAAQVLSRVEAPVPSVNQLDPPEHTRLRKALHPFFARHRIARLEDAIRAEARALLRDRAGADFDAVRDLAEPIAAHVACGLLGLPREEAALVLAWVERYARNDPSDRGRSQDALAAAREMNAYLAEKVAARRKGGAGGDAGVIDLFLGHEIGGRRLADLEIASHLQTLVVGGTDTTPKVIAAALVHLHARPADRARVAREPSLAPAAFAEALRLDMPTQFMARTVARDVTLHGQSLRRGQGVLLLFASANRDAAEFPQADAFDLDRAPARTLGFGHGPHLCLGLHVARLEGRVVLEELLRAAPEYGVDADGIERRSADQLRGIVRLPLALR